MPIITWNHSCCFCHRPIIHGKPAVTFATNNPFLMGVSHSACVATKYHIGHHQMNPPDFLSREQVAFLIQCYPMMYSLPGGVTADATLRKCVADFLWYYPAILANPMKCLHQFREQNKGNVQSYEGDLEADYLKFLATAQKAAKENPVDVEFDFP